MGIMQLLSIGVVWFILGLTASHFAKKRGRSAYLWFWIGFCFQILGVLAVFLVPKRKKPPSPPSPTLMIEKNDAWLKMWYYLDLSHSQQGPIEFPDLIQKWKVQEIALSSYVWGEGMKEWKQLTELPELLKEFPVR